MLRLEAEGEVLLIGDAALADDGAVEEVARVELDPGLVRPDLHDPPALRLLDMSREGEHPASAPQHEVVVVAALDPADPLADRVGRGEVERRSGHGHDLARRDEVGGRIHGGDRVGFDLEHMAEDVAPALALEVPIGVVGQVDDGRLVGRGLVADLELVRVGQRVNDRDGEVPGEALLLVLTEIAQPDAGAVLRLDGLAGPDNLVEALDPAMEGVRVVVRGQLVFDPVQRESRLADAVPVAADDGPEIGVRAEIALEIVEPQIDVGQGAVPVGDLERNEDGPVGHDPGLEPVGVGQGEDLDGRAVGQPPEMLPFGFHRRRSFAGG